MSGPPAEPHGKDLIAPTMSFSDISKSSVRFATGGVEICESGWGGGCLDCRASKVSSLKSANGSLELASLMAPLKSPSSILVVTLCASWKIGSGHFLACFVRLVPGYGVTVVENSSWSWRFTMVDNDSVCLPLRGCLRHLGANRKSRFHDATELHRTISPRIAASLELHSCLADLVIRHNTLILGIVARAGVASEGDEEIKGEKPRGDGNGNDCVSFKGDLARGCRGSLPEPGHRAVNGPWTLIKPAELVDRDRSTQHKKKNNNNNNNNNT